MFGKSRAAISKIVRPDNVEKLKQKKSQLWAGKELGLDPASSSQIQSSAAPALEEDIRGIRKASARTPRKKASGHPLNPVAGGLELQASVHSMYMPSQHLSSQFHVDRHEMPPQRSYDFSAFQGMHTAQNYVQTIGSAGPFHVPGAMLPSFPFPLAQPLNFQIALPQSFSSATISAPPAQSDVKAPQTDSLENTVSLSINIKSSITDDSGTATPVSRRLRVDFNMSNGLPVQGYKHLLGLLIDIHSEDILRLQTQDGNATDIPPNEVPKMFYVDNDGDLITVSSDHELGVAFEFSKHTASGAGAREPTLRITLKFKS